MKTILIAFLMVGLSSAAIQQQRSPVYQPSVTSTGSTVTSVNATPIKPSSVVSSTSPMTPAPIPPVQSPQPVAQARESVATDASMIQSTAVNPSTPSQNYYVYYYPHNGAGTDTRTAGQPNSASIFSSIRWPDVGAFVLSVGLVLIGAGTLYSRFANTVKSRALRELKDISAEDAARMARGVLRAIEKFSAMNSE